MKFKQYLTERTAQQVKKEWKKWMNKRTNLTGNPSKKKEYKEARKKELDLAHQYWKLTGFKFQGLGQMPFENTELSENDDLKIIGRNHKLSMMYPKMKAKGNIKDEWINTIKTEHEIYDKILNALKKGTQGHDLGKMSTTQGFREAMNMIVKEVEKAIPNTFTKQNFSALTKKSISLKGYGSFPLSDNYDIADYLTAVAMQKKGLTNPEDHKAWFKR